DLNMAGDILVGSFTHVNGLAPGASYSLEKQVALPNGAEGDYYLFGITDATGRVVELDESNNQLSAAISVVLTVPDLTVSSVSGPDTVLAGQPAMVGWSVRNDGNGPGYPSSWYDGVYLSRDQILDETDYNLGARYRQGGLAIGGSYPDSLQATIPIGLTGRHYFFIKTDKANSVYEHDKEDNNIAYTTDGVEIFVLPPDYDLEVVEIVMPDSRFVGEEINISWTVANNGASDLSGQWLDAVYVSADTIWDIDDAHLGTAVRRTGLTAGGVYRQMLTVAASDFYGALETAVPGLEPGEYRLLVKTDIYNQINELDESNNEGHSVSGLDLDVVPLTLGVPQDSTVGANGQHYYRATFPPGEDLKLTVDIGHEFDEFELYVSFGELPDRIGYFRKHTVDGHEEIILATPDTTVCYLMMFGDFIVGGGAYTITAESILFGLTAVSPSGAGTEQFVSFDLTGGQLDQVTGVRLRHEGGGEIDAWALDATSSTRLGAAFDLHGAAVGTYDCIAYTGFADSSVLASAIVLNDGSEPSVAPNIHGPVAIRQSASIDYTISLYNNSNGDAHDLIHSMKLDYGTQYQLLLDDGLAQIRISDGEPVLLYTNYIGVGAVETYTVRIWGSIDTGLEAMTVFFDPEFRTAGARSLVMSSWVNPVVDEFVARVSSLGQAVDGQQLWSNLVDVWDAPMTLLGEKMQTVSLDRKIGTSLRLALEGELGVSPTYAGELGETGGARAFLGSTGAVDEGVLSAIGEARDQYLAAASSGRFQKKRQDVTVRIARDPNEKFGPTAEGAENFVNQWQDLPYTIYFENVPTASAAAQNVLITDQLDDDLDWRKFRLGEIAFGDVTVQVPENFSYYHTAVTLESGYLLEIDAGLNGATGLVHWSFSTVDPATGLPPLDPGAGFLPPNDSTRAGEGHVRFTIRADGESPNGTEISNKALIVFDDNDPIETRTVL
ncbi:MAG: CARDB domain-containing protein, partial [Candidatus Krumholzibacteria bacterium]|nr:CARDB domain-containing protein [Candidatus Krumholzibacteria bacterium]